MLSVFHTKMWTELLHACVRLMIRIRADSWPFFRHFSFLFFFPLLVSYPSMRASKKCENSKDSLQRRHEPANKNWKEWTILLLIPYFFGQECLFVVHLIFCSLLKPSKTLSRQKLVQLINFSSTSCIRKCEHHKRKKEKLQQRIISTEWRKEIENETRS